MIKMLYPTRGVWRLLPALLLTCFACTKPAATDASRQVLRVGASPVPHEEILRRVVEPLAAEGVTLQVVTFNDYVQPNLRLMDGDLDANYYQTIPYLENFANERHCDLVNVGSVHIEPFGLYSRKHKALADVPAGALVAIPNEQSNGHRALRLLQQAGLLSLDPSKGYFAGVRDITANPRGLRFKEIEAAMMPRVLDDVDVAGINTNFALQIGLTPDRDALSKEDRASPYANIVVAREKDAEAPVMAKLMAALRSKEVRGFIEAQYKGAVSAAF
jgi:D-methionine transport system substrate-binding protein